MAFINRVLQLILFGLIRSYQLLLSPFVGQHCRYFPSCSHYAKDAVHYHGPWRGSWMAVKRVCRCHPWHDGGIDLVPGSEHDYESSDNDLAGDITDKTKRETIETEKRKS